MYTMTLTKGYIQEIAIGNYAISVNLVVNDGEEDVLVRSIFFNFDTNTTTIEEAQAAFLQKVKEEWDKYLRISADSKLDPVDAALVEVATEADDYINP